MNPWILALLILTGGVVGLTLIGCFFVFVVQPLMAERRQRLKMDEKMLAGSLSDVDVKLEFAKLHAEVNEIKRLLQQQLPPSRPASALPVESATEREQTRQTQ
ncbi:MAG: hypothetical protein NZT92_17205 [Abditibacteriales bacterium]|nr:hypothetical protein [Abditibacteriales bacterium]MDW8367606.1 hypothetical protein [Abditibacteriales bacterium]